MSKIPVYFIPGMASSPLIFEHIKLDNSIFETIFLQWPKVQSSYTLQNYVSEFQKQIVHPNPVIIGVSFGGIITQELSKCIKTRKTIIISSAKNIWEYPSLYRFAKKTSLYKLLPTWLIKPLLNYYPSWSKQKRSHRISLYKRYITVTDKEYLNWSIDKILHWKQEQPIKNVIHIHGEKDELFPIKNIKNAIVLKQGTHAMIITKYKWFNENLPKLILDSTYEQNN
ncbi:alpha/beta hydrolase [Myroides sp. LJL119]